MAIAPDRFAAFIAIDWSGAVGERQRGIAVALCRHGSDAPRLLGTPGMWSRQQVGLFLLTRLTQDTLVGLDLGTSLPFVDHAAFFPGWSKTPADARALWALIDRICAADPHLSATSFVDHVEAARHFRRHGARQGDLFEPGRGRLRETERAQGLMGLNPVSNLNLVGAAQVGKSSLTGMRLLHQLGDRIPVWPFDVDPGTGPLLVEIYTSLAAREAGRPPGRSKMRDTASLNLALASLGSDPVPDTGPIDDHASDAILTAAWLRVAAPRAALWTPAALTAKIARTEGWTFGAA